VGVEGRRDVDDRTEAEALFDGWTVERFEEEENDGEACSGPKHWHLFHVIALARERPDVMGRRALELCAAGPKRQPVRQEER
jgi:hypothetical protein